MTPAFVVDLPGGGGKRLASTYEEYDKETGVSYWRAPGLTGEKGKQIYTYFDPYPVSLSAEEVRHRHEQTKRLVKHECARLRAEAEAYDGTGSDDATTAKDPNAYSAAPPQNGYAFDTSDDQMDRRAAAHG
jgi:hypothetical protein